MTNESVPVEEAQKTRKEVIAELKSKGVKFNPTSKTAELESLLGGEESSGEVLDEESEALSAYEREADEEAQLDEARQFRIRAEDIEVVGATRPTVKHVGRHPLLKPDSINKKTFLAINKELMLHVNPHKIIIFKGGVYLTDNDIEIKWLRKHEVFDDAFFEGEYPKHVLDKMKWQSNLLTRQADLLDSGAIDSD